MQSEGAMRLWIKDTGRWLTIAFVAGAWCAGWLCFLLESTRGPPGILYGAPGRGAFELVETFGLSYGTALLALFLLGALPVLLLGLLRNALDPDRRAASWLRWPLRSPSLVAAGLIWMALGVAVVASGSKYLMWSGLLAAFAVTYLTPFAVWNKDVLDAARPARWWRPRWPGWVTAAVYMALLAVNGLSQLALDKAADASPGLVISLLLSVAGWLLDACLVIAMIVVWINRAEWKSVRRDLGLMWGNKIGIAGELAWAFLCLATVALTLLAPVPLAAAWAVYYMPYYNQWLGASHQATPLAVQLTLWLVEHVVKFWYLIAMWSLPALGALYLDLALGRMVRPCLAASDKTGS